MKQNTVPDSNMFFSPESFREVRNQSRLLPFRCLSKLVMEFVGFQNSMGEAKWVMRQRPHHSELNWKWTRVKPIHGACIRHERVQPPKTSKACRVWGAQARGAITGFACWSISAKSNLPLPFSARPLTLSQENRWAFSLSRSGCMLHFGSWRNRPCWHLDWKGALNCSL